MIPIGSRTFKTAVGSALSIWIAQLCQLDFPSSAGILTILCIQVTKKRSLKSGFDRFFACLLGLLVSGMLFSIAGYTPLVFSLFISLFIPLLLKAKVQEGFVSSIVIVLHLYTVESFTLSVFLNETFLIVIGIGMALIMNSHMPNLEKQLLTHQVDIEEKFKVILHEFSRYLINKNNSWDGKELLEAESLINSAKSLAIRDVENHLLRKENLYYSYFEMRERQYELLKRMMPIISSFTKDIPQKEIFASFLEELSTQVHSGNTTAQSLCKLKDNKEKIEQTDLPQTQEEFETRANLFYLINEMENYLEIKRKYAFSIGKKR